MAYSPVTHPKPLASRHAGTRSSTEAVQRTRVLPVSIMQDPSAYGETPVSMLSRRMRSLGRSSRIDAMGSFTSLAVVWRFRGDPIGWAFRMVRNASQIGG
jgi:hypothetical protein